MAKGRARGLEQRFGSSRERMLADMARGAVERAANDTAPDDFHVIVQRSHAANRARERYRVTITRDRLAELSDLMDRRQQSEGLVLLGYRAGSSIWFVSERGHEMIAAFDERTRSIATFLPGGNAWHARFDGQRFVNLYSGGHPAGVAWMKARIAARQERAA